MYFSPLPQLVLLVSGPANHYQAEPDHRLAVVDSQRATIEIGQRLVEFFQQISLGQDLIVGVSGADRADQLSPGWYLSRSQWPTVKSSLARHHLDCSPPIVLRQHNYCAATSSELAGSRSQPQASSPLASTAAGSAATSRKMPPAAVAPHSVSAASTMAAPV